MQHLRISLILLIISFSISSMDAQNRGNNDKEHRQRFEKFKKERIDYITTEMDLDSKEASVFWPICNELQEKKFEINRNNRQSSGNIFQQIRKKEKVSDEDYTRMIIGNAETKIQEAQLDKIYLEKMLKVIPAEKVARYQRAEQHFAEKVVSEREKERNKRGNDNNINNNRSK